MTEIYLVPGWVIMLPLLCIVLIGLWLLIGEDVMDEFDEDPWTHEFLSDEVWDTCSVLMDDGYMCDLTAMEHKVVYEQ